MDFERLGSAVNRDRLEQLFTEFADLMDARLSEMHRQFSQQYAGIANHVDEQVKQMYGALAQTRRMAEKKEHPEGTVGHLQRRFANFDMAMRVVQNFTNDSLEYGLACEIIEGVLREERASFGDNGNRGEASGDVQGAPEALEGSALPEDPDGDSPGE